LSWARVDGDDGRVGDPVDLAQADGNIGKVHDPAFPCSNRVVPPAAQHEIAIGSEASAVLGGPPSLDLAAPLDGGWEPVADHERRGPDPDTSLALRVGGL
jgi:hypothetical protein